MIIKKRVSFLTGVKGYLQKILDILVTLGGTILFCLVLYQVFARYVLHKPLAMSQGTCQLILLFVVFVGTVVALGTNSHISIDLITSNFNEKAQRYIHIFNLFFMNVLLIFYSFSIYRLLINSRGIFPNPPVPIQIYYFPIFMGAVFCWIYVTIDIIEIFIEKKETASGAKLKARRE